MADVSYFLSLPYTKTLKRDEDDDFIASVLELPGCKAHGASEAEALENLVEAQTGWLELALENEYEIPLPEPEEDLPSGKWLTRVPKSLHLRLNRLAKRDDTSLNQLVLVALTQYVTLREAQQEMRAFIEWHRAAIDPPKWQRLPRPTAARYLDKFRQDREIGKSSADPTSDPHFHQKRR